MSCEIRQGTFCYECRNFIGIELSLEYCEMARRRIADSWQSEFEAFLAVAL
jgi:DNA modification methylase